MRNLVKSYMNTIDRPYWMISEEVIAAYRGKTWALQGRHVTAVIRMIYWRVRHEVEIRTK